MRIILDLPACAAAALALATVARTQAPDWIQAPVLQPRFEHAMAYDFARGRTVLFGGYSDQPLTDTWEWDGTDWLLRQRSSGPPARRLHAMAYDSVRRCVVLHGGFANTDTWEWDGAVWVQRTPVTGVVPVGWPAMVYDAARQRTVLFSVRPFGVPETWEWDGNQWTQRFPTASPTARTGQAMAYDAGRQRTVLFGGYGLLSDTWEWDGMNWTQQFPAHVPPGRGGHGMAYDAGRQLVVMFSGGGLGGSYSGPLGNNDTWEWNGLDWTQRQPANAPAARQGYAMVYDAARQRIVVIGGETASTRLADVWEWDGTTWTEARRSTCPIAREDSALAYDATRGRTVLFGGGCVGATMFGVLADTWEWDGAGWNELRPVVAPLARTHHAMAADVVSGRVLLFGGGNSSVLADTWTWDGVAWTQHLPATSPPARSNHAMACDAARGRVTLFGGRTATVLFGDTWEWNGSTWLQQSPATSPSARDGHAMAYDPARQRVLLVGGTYNFVADAWEWDGTNWTSQSSSVPWCYQSALVHDAARQRMVLFDGAGAALGSLSLGTFERIGPGNWTQVQTNASPTSRYRHALAYDAARQRVVAFGGQLLPNGADASTWLLGTLTPASVQTIGTPCGGAGGAPRLTASTPASGQRMALDLLGAPPLAPCLFAFAPASQSLALGGGCTLYLQNPVLPQFALGNAAGFASLRWSVPADPALRGAAVYAQAVALDPTSGPLGLAFTAAQQLTAGD
jgi:hypothetical protein